ncbi:MAG: diguanylate cyclase [Gammaproteobacteria bacterium]|nr:diguanylate cyclase [Gammaproteobacteria bacterium]
MLKSNILLVDDDDFTRRLVRKSLFKAGHNVIDRNCGQAALRVVEQQRIDLLLLDVQMPEMDGFEVCARLRGSKKHRRLPIVMLTSLDDLDSVTEAFEAGATDFITKPINIRLLNERVKYSLRTHAMTQELLRNKQLLVHAQRIAGLGYLEFDLLAKVVTVSGEARRIFGWQAQCTQISFSSGLSQVVQEDVAKIERAIERVFRRKSSCEVEYRIVRNSGEERWLRMKLEILDLDLGNDSKLLGIVEDITERKRQHDDIMQRALYDGLTHLPNRELLNNRLHKALQSAKRNTTSVAVLFLDLDNFKQVNDRYGHGVGDDLLKSVAHCLRENMRKSDTAARFGGDEFVCLLPNIEPPLGAMTLAENLLARLTETIQTLPYQAEVTVSIGVAIYPEDADGLEALIRCADEAMYHSKANGKNQICRFLKRVTV